mmetsp:Transcript_5398/g.10579  ORF Transcript_5398/g.10579 Transcript_5398/m.10579 type:complete len:489 (+) Transcript_5398:58-1524(+)
MTCLLLPFVFALAPARGVRAATAATAGGARASISQMFLDYAVKTAVPILEQEILQETIPDQSGKSSGFEYTVSNIKITQFTVGSPQLSFVEAKGLQMELDGITLRGTMSWRYRGRHWPHVKDHGGGDFEVGGNTHAAGLLVLSLASGRPHAALSGAAASLDHFKIKLHGGASWLYNMVVHAFEGHIKGSIENSLRDEMTDAVDNALNKEFAKMRLTEKLPFDPPYDIALIDYTFTDITTKSDHVSVTVRASINDTSGTQKSFPLPPPALPSTNSSDLGRHHVTLQMSTFPVDSMAYVFYNRGLLRNEVTPKDLDSFGFVLSTDTFLPVAPGLSKWPHTNMTIDAMVASLPTSTARFDENELQIDTPAMFAFYVNSPKGRIPVFNITGPVVAAAALSVAQTPAGQVLHCKFTNATCAPLAVNATTVGPVDSERISDVITFVLDAVVPIANAALAGGLPLPSFEGVEATNTSITTRDNVCTVCSNVHYGG